MMRKWTLALLAAVGVSAAYSQCGPRYHSYIFEDSLVSNIQYGSNVDYQGGNVNLMLDMYFPKGDAETTRPLVIMAHGGSFVGGSKTGGDVVPLCQDLTSMGYVVASIDYRVGMNGLPFPGPDSTDAAEAVVRASHDGKAAVRFFKDSYTNGNPYGIDTSHIYFTGVSAGGFIALNVGYLDDINEFPNWIDTTNEPGLSGGVEGMSGYQSYSSNVTGIINIAGAIRDTSWIEPGDIPLLSFHGDQDGTVPIGSETITLLGAFPLLVVHGSESIDIRADNVGITNCFEKHEGQDHVPHASNADYYDTTITIMRNFLAHLVCNDALDCNYGPAITAVNELAINASMEVYPNPVERELTVELSDEVTQATGVFLDLSGREVSRVSIRGGQQQLDVSGLAKGSYLFKVFNEDVELVRKVVVR